MLARVALVAIWFVAVLTAPAFAYAANPAQCTRNWDEAQKTHTTDAQDYKTFMMACLQSRGSPTTPQMDRPANVSGKATGRCRDGLYSFGADPTRACAQHRGVQVLFR
jgi:hypothetical protein